MFSTRGMSRRGLNTACNGMIGMVTLGACTNSLSKGLRMRLNMYALLSSTPSWVIVVNTLPFPDLVNLTPCLGTSHASYMTVHALFI